MCEISPAEGFIEINENLGDMIKYIANEPSVGLYYTQQHAQNAIPNVVRLKNNIMDKSNEVSFHTEDLEDCITTTRTMKECGFPIIDEMIRDIKSVLTITSSKQPVSGVLSQRSLSYKVSDSENPGSYFSSVFRSAREKAVNFTWVQQDSRTTEKDVLTHGSNSAIKPDEYDEMPLTNNVDDDIIKEHNLSTAGKTRQLLPEERDFDEFKAEKEALLEDWLASSVSVL